jgi:hypothetical protein
MPAIVPMQTKRSPNGQEKRSLYVDKFHPDTVFGVFFHWRTLYSRVSTVKTIITR